MEYIIGFALGLGTTILVTQVLVIAVLIVTADD